MEQRTTIYFQHKDSGMNLNESSAGQQIINGTTNDQFTIFVKSYLN